MSRQPKPVQVQATDAVSRVIRLPKATKEVAQEQRTVSELTMEQWLTKTIETTLPKVSARLVDLGFAQFSTKQQTTKWSLQPAALEALRKVSKQTTLPMNLLLALCITNGEYKTPKAKAAPKAAAPKAKAPRAKKGGK